MNDNRVPDYLDPMLEAAVQACAYVEGLSKDESVWDTVQTALPLLIAQLPSIRQSLN